MIVKYEYTVEIEVNASITSDILQVADATRNDPYADQRECTYNSKGTSESEVLTCLDRRRDCKHSF